MECLTIPEDGSLVRVFHAVPNLTAVDVYVNDSLAFRDLNFRQFTNYLPLTSGQYTISLYSRDITSPAVLTVNLNVPIGGIFTLVATGNIHDLELLVLDDMEAEGVQDNISKVRVVHLAPNAPAVNIQLDGVPFIQGIQFREMTPYAPVSPATYIATVLDSMTNTPIFQFRVQLRENLISTVYLIGESAQLSAIQSIDGSSYLCSEQATMEEAR